MYLGSHCTSVSRFIVLLFLSSLHLWGWRVQGDQRTANEPALARGVFLTSIARSRPSLDRGRPPPRTRLAVGFLGTAGHYVETP